MFLKLFNQMIQPFLSHFNLSTKLFFKISFLLILLAFINPVQAQVVNIEKQRVSDTIKSLQGSVDFSLDLTQNTKQIIQGESVLRLQYYKGNHLFLLLNDIGLGQIDGDRFLNKGFVHLRYNYKFKDSPFILEVFSQYQYNSIQALKSRYLAGIGPRIQLINEEKGNLYFGPLVMYEYEIVDDINSPENSDFRLSTYFSFAYMFTKNISFNQVTYYQPNVSGFSDYRISSVSNVAFKILKNLSFIVGFDFIYDTKPPTDIEPLFYSLKNKLTIKF